MVSGCLKASKVGTSIRATLRQLYGNFTAVFTAVLIRLFVGIKPLRQKRQFFYGKDTREKINIYIATLSIEL